MSQQASSTSDTDDQHPQRGYERSPTATVHKTGSGRLS
jgi:hypothetical protein